MSEIKPIPDGREHLIPHLVVSDARKALEFYKQALGSETLIIFDGPEDKVMHAEFQVGSSVIYLNDDFPEMSGGKHSTPEAIGGTPVTLHQYVEDVDSAMAKFESAGGTITMPAEDMFWGDRYGAALDPFGHQWSFSTQVANPTIEEMNAARAEFEQQ